MTGWWCNATGSKYIANVEILENITIFLSDGLRQTKETHRTMAREDAIPIIALLFAMLGDNPITCPTAVALAPIALAISNADGPAHSYLTAILTATMRLGVRTKVGPTARLTRKEENIIDQYGGLVAASMAASSGPYAFEHIVAYVKQSANL